MTVKDAICFMKNLGEILVSQTLHPSMEEPLLNGQAEPPPDRNPSGVAAEESGRRLAPAVLESMDAIKLDAGSIRRGTTRLTDRRPQFAARQVGR